MCTIDWGLFAAVVGALSTLGLLIAAILGYGVWKAQFLRTRDHEVARRLLKAISDSEIVFSELRTPHALFSDMEVPVPPPEIDDLPGQHEHRRMFFRYKARSIHLATVRAERSVALLEALALWEDEEYTSRLGELVNQLAPLETAVMDQAATFVDSLAPGEGVVEVDRDVLFSPLDLETPDKVGKDFWTIKNNIVKHLRPKLRMEAQKPKGHRFVWRMAASKSPAGAGP